jgi:hypothetical protein
MRLIRRPGDAVVVPLGNRVATVMTQQYLAGELSVLLAELQAELPATVGDRPAAQAAARLRGEAETAPVARLAPVAGRALELVDAACWRSVADGDLAAFHRQAAVAAELFDFCVCAGLMPSDSEHIPEF